MLPDIPATKKEVSRKLLREIQRQAAEINPLLRMGHSVTQHEGNRYMYEQKGHGMVEGSFQRFETKIEVPFCQAADLGRGSLGEKLRIAADDLARQTSVAGYAALDEAIRKGGTSVDMGGKPISQDSFLSIFERIDMIFHPDGTPDLVFLVHPETAKAMQAYFEDWRQNTDFLARWERLINRKREEWIDRESGRKLVD